ncbi:DUF4124 domain-containing protein [Sinimarinibacterium sp. CAU 1509]|uniref:DUF4124 domain-containing protein n=1 Tax=Sinimarinibacterium sp. CAU 1509 TaxID=2562283 RepID=UPI00146A1CF3|nr:DUF4124 domain-containing protein [Sinimarinibacterium sp. CAU 1509]
MGCLAWAPVARAADEVYRCQVDGATVFSDKPCGDSAERIDVPPPMILPPPSGPKVDLLGEAERRDQRAAERKAKADAEWTADYQARKEQEEKLRAARIADEIVTGMTPEDVRRMRGDPITVATSQSGKSQRMTWSYLLDDGSRLHVKFTDGVVSSTSLRQEKK